MDKMCVLLFGHPVDAKMYIPLQKCTSDISNVDW